MNAANRKIITWAAAIFASGCWAYSLAARYTDFLVAPKPEKVVIFSILITLTTLLSAWLFLVVLNPILTRSTCRRILLSAGLSILVILIIFIFTYKMPPFPEKHILIITPAAEKNPYSAGTSVEISSLRTISLPANKSKRIPKSQLVLNGSWQGTGTEFGIKTNEGTGTSVSLDRFMQAGIAIEFLSSPQAGMVHILWDGEEQIADLYSPSPSTRTIQLKPHLVWIHADMTRKILVAGAFITDLFGLAIILLSVFLWTTEFLIVQKLSVRKPGLHLLCLITIFALQFTAFKINKSVVFENPQIEDLIRDTLENPNGEISQRQLLTIVKLNASGRNLTSLTGIEKISNLVELDLSNNRIGDLTPLEKLKNLKKLNLRNNDLTDLSPLAQITSLTNLNIQSNTKIRSIEPLKGLAELKKLIMADVPIGQEIHILENLRNLTHLNMRSCGVTDLDPISHLKNLDYLNLHSNPEISSITPLKQLTNLHTLILANIPIGDSIETLAYLHQLKYLNLRNTNLADISVLARLTNLEYLNLHSNSNIQSIEPVRKMTGIQTLILENVPIGSQIEFVKDLHDLRKLNIRNCEVTNISVIGQLMAGGALQDSVKAGFKADIDIRDNPIRLDNEDRFISLRPYWANISIRQPYALPFFTEIHKVIFSKLAGFYEDNFLLELSHSDPTIRIHFTSDASEPTSRSKVYSEPIPISSRSGEVNEYSAIQSVAADWNKPKTEVAKAVIIRAVAIDERTGKASEVTTQTYFIGAEFKKKYTMPVISLVTDAKNLFDSKSGIYVLGESYMDHVEEDITEDERQAYANYNQHGRVWERPISIEIFETENELSFSQNGGLRIHGGGSRRYPQKTLRVYAGEEYAFQNIFDYPLFGIRSFSIDGQHSQTYKTFLLRNSGQDWLRSTFRDAFVQRLNGEMGLDTQASRPVVVFLDGEYWGIYTLQERYDEFYLLNNFSILPEKSVILRQDGELYRGDAGDEGHYFEMLRYIRENGLQDQQHYRYIQTQMDVTNYMDYLIAEIYAGNDDWPDNNVFLWRMKTGTYDPEAPLGQDGRWRWMLFDLDFGFGLQGGESDITADTIEVAKSEGWSGFLFRSLLENEQFRSEFVKQFLDRINSTYAPERVIPILNKLKAELDMEIEEHLSRWNSDPNALVNWEKEVDLMREFALKRPDAMQTLIEKHFAKEPN